MTDENIQYQNLIEYSEESSNTESIETTKSELIQCILNSLTPSSTDDTSNLHDLEDVSNKIYIHFNEKYQLGIKPTIDDLLEELEYSKKCSCHQMNIIFNNDILNQQLSYKQKQTILRLILRQQQIFNRFFSTTKK